jgi:hypothetical protein
MDESSKFSGFKVSDYKQLLLDAKKKFKFVDYNAEDQYEINSILWRHDVDASLNRALALARIESNLDVRSTYLIYLHSDFYNALETSQKKIIREINFLGHSIGLHFDVSHYELHNEQELEIKLSFEKLILEELLGSEIKVFSFHNPGKNSEKFKRNQYSGMTNCYSDQIFKKFAYCSDSNGYWRFKPLSEVINDPSINMLQVLTHPEWWQEKLMSPRERIARCSIGRNEATLRLYDNAIVDANRKNEYGVIGNILLQNKHHPDEPLYEYLLAKGKLPSYIKNMLEIEHSLECEYDELSKEDIERFKHKLKCGIKNVS